MASLCLKTGRKELNWITQYLARFWRQPQKRTMFSKTQGMTELAKRRLLYNPVQTFCTAGDSKENIKGNKINYTFNTKIENVGRRIPYLHVQLIDENGENMGVMHRADVLRLMDARGLRLVLLRENTKPPMYRLMSGLQIYEERLRFKEKQKAGSKSGPVQTKEIRFSTDIAQHDLDIKLRQVEKWIDHKYHVKVVVNQHKASVGSEKMLLLFDKILASMPGKVTYLSEPHVKEGSSKCVLRHMSDKEIQEYKKMGKKKDDQQNIDKIQKNKDQQESGKDTTD
nr:translation initiation factor IF-3, mitochondrial [Pogona vitticeps]XP_020644244.1 translation initiation factor IF-3, mitochondrial [Pogona vitticeps]